MCLMPLCWWWPLHPIVYPVSATFLINYHWFAILLAWVFIDGASGVEGNVILNF